MKKLTTKLIQVFEKVIAWFKGDPYTTVLLWAITLVFLWPFVIIYFIVKKFSQWIGED